MKRFLLYVVLIAVAAVCYFIGFGEAVVPLVLIYIVLEITVGSRLGAAFRRR